jgi:hypothetical protein
MSLREEIPLNWAGVMKTRDRVTAEISDLFYRMFGLRTHPSTCLSDSELHAVEKELRVALPLSYRTYLRYFGAENQCCQELFGLPRDDLWGDLVLMNRLGSDGRPLGLVKFSEDEHGQPYYLDTSRMDAEGECPVVRLDSEQQEIAVADSFLDFLRMLGTGQV